MRAKGLLRLTAALQVFLLLASLFLPGLAAAATIQTDLYVYQSGDTVSVTGAGFGDTETVDFVTTDPDGATVDTGSATSDSPGSVAYSFVLNATVSGLYTITAAGETSGLTASTQFDPPINTSTTLAAISTPLTAGQTGIAWSGSVSVSGSNPGVPDGSTVRLQYFAASDCSGTGTNQAFATTSSGSYSGTFTAPSSGTYGFRAQFVATSTGSGQTLVQWGESHSACRVIVVNPVATNHAPTDPGAPTLDAGSSTPNNTGTFTIDWAASTDPDAGDSVSYELQKHDSSTSSWTSVASGLASTARAFSGEAEGSWTYRVAATDNHSASSGWATDSSAIVIVDKHAPTFGACPAVGPFTYGQGGGSVSVGSINASDPALSDGSIGSGVNTGDSTLSGSVDTSSVGPKNVTFTAYDNAGNSATKNCPYSVGEASLTITASSPAGPFFYGDDPPAISATFDGFVLGDDSGDLGGTLVCGTSYLAGDAPGDYATSCSGATSGNYDISYINGSFHVGKKSLAVTASSPADGVYGDAAPTITPQYSGFVPGETESDLTTAPTCGTAYTQVASSTPGDYATSCSGGVSDNYAFSYVDGNFHVGKKTLTVTASSPADGVYGDPVPSVTPSYSGFVYSQTESDLTTAPTCGTAYTQVASSTPGDYATSCSGGVSDNYAFSYVDGKFHVGKAPLQVTASSPADGVYGDAAPSVTPSYSGFVYSQTESDLTTAPACTTTASQFSPVGSYPITCSGGVSDNYAFSYVAGTLRVTYAAGGDCLGSPGHAILQPINPTAPFSVFKKGSTVPAKFRVCDANGASIGSAGVVTDFKQVGYISSLGSTYTVEDVVSTTPDTQFRWDPSAQQWIFNINTKNKTAGVTYLYRISLNDGTFIDFQFGLK